MGLSLTRRIASGAMGEVYEARDPALDRAVAVKIARRDAGSDARQALRAEAALAARLEHPAVLPVHRLVEVGPDLCLELRLAPPSTLAAWFTDVRQGHAAAWPMPTCIRLAATLADALALAHDRGVVHGDLHPGNVAIAPDGATVALLDWTGTSRPGTFTGHPGYCAPERLRGVSATFADDAFSLGAVLYELTTGRPLRPRRLREPLDAFVARVHAAPDAPDLAAVPDGLADLVAACLAADPAARPTLPALRDALVDHLTGSARRAARAEEAARLVDVSREALARHREVRDRLVDERQVVTVQRARVPGHAPVAQKRSLWSAESRVADLERERDDTWLEALDTATRASAMAVDATDADALLADLWWERMRMAEVEHDVAMARTARQRVLARDAGRYVQVLDSPARLTLRCDVPGATATIHRWREVDRVRVPEPVETVPMPLEGHRLAPGSWLVVVSAPGFADARWPVLLSRHEHVTDTVRLVTDAQIGDGWCYVPAGRFLLGGDPHARQPLDRCTPTLDDFFVMRTCITCADWAAWLATLDPDAAREHVPGARGIDGAFVPAWVEHDGRWTVPPGLDPRLPIHDVSYHDVEAYARWRSDDLGRAVRLPTEDEWEKAARGADGRWWPWGNGFDPTYAHMRQSVPGPPRPAPVGTYPVDESVYGCRDMAGGMREFTLSTFDVGQVVLRGGTWGDDADDLRCACRSGLQPGIRIAFVSARLVSTEPAPV